MPDNLHYSKYHIIFAEKNEREKEVQDYHS